MKSPISSLSKSSTRQAIIIVQLLMTLVLTALLAYQAQDAARSHRLTAEAVLKDYAGLAAREFASTSANRLSYLGATPVFRLFRNVPWPELPEPVSAANLKLFGLDEALLKQPNKLSFCRMNTTTADLFHGGQHDRPELVGFLDALKQFEYQNRWPFALLFSGDRERCLMVRRVNYTRDRFEGIVFDIDLLSAFFDRLLAEKPLMPISRNNQAPDNRALLVSVTGPHDWVYSAGKGENGLRATTTFDYGLKDLQVSVAVDPEMAGDLIIGGLPGSRLPTLILLLLVTVGLVAVSVWLLMRERSLSLRQSDSLAAISHELRTPLTQIQMFVETLLLERVRSPDETRDALEIIFGESKRMGDLVENAIRFSSALHGVAKLVLIPIDIEPFLREQVDHYRPILRDRAGRLRLKLSDSAMVSAEPRYLSLMLRNLIDNALKYGPTGSSVKLGWTRVGDQLQLWVEDEGEGVPPKYRELIWRRFTRLPKHRHTAVGGTGVGLWLVRELARAQGATAWVEEGAKGGARFVLAFALLDGEVVAKELAIFSEEREGVAES